MAEYENWQDRFRRYMDTRDRCFEVICHEQRPFIDWAREMGIDSMNRYPSPISQYLFHLFLLYY